MSPSRPPLEFGSRSKERQEGHKKGPAPGRTRKDVVVLRTTDLFALLLQAEARAPEPAAD